MLLGPEVTEGNDRREWWSRAGRSPQVAVGLAGRGSAPLPRVERREPYPRSRCAWGGDGRG